jgi:hypothetical protein
MKSFPRNISSQCDESLKSKGIKVFWFFESPCVKYGAAKINGKTWQFSLCAARKQLKYFPCENFERFLHSPTPEMRKGIEKAKKFLAETA